MKWCWLLLLCWLFSLQIYDLFLWHFPYSSLSSSSSFIFLFPPLNCLFTTSPLRSCYLEIWKRREAKVVNLHSLNHHANKYNDLLVVDKCKKLYVCSSNAILCTSANENGGRASCWIELTLYTITSSIAVNWLLIRMALLLFLFSLESALLLDLHSLYMIQFCLWAVSN